MPIFRKGDRKIAFIHIPKAAGSRIEMHFTSSGWEMDFYKPCSHPNTPAIKHSLHIFVMFRSVFESELCYIFA